MPPDENNVTVDQLDNDTKVNERGQQIPFSGNREERRRRAKAIARANHLPFQTVNKVLSNKATGPVAL